MGLGEKLMKIVVLVSDVVELAKRFRAEPLAAMSEAMSQVRAAVVQTLEQGSAVCSRVASISAKSTVTVRRRRLGAPARLDSRPRWLMQSPTLSTGRV